MVARKFTVGEAISERTWLHRGDILRQKTKNQRVVVIHDIIYNPDLTRTFILRPISDQFTEVRTRGMLTYRAMKNRTRTHETTVIRSYVRLRTEEVRIA